MTSPEDEGINQYRSPDLVVVDTASKIEARLEAMHGQMTSDRDEYNYLNDYFRGAHTLPHIPVFASEEIRELRRRAVMNLMPLLVSIPAQISFVDGYRRDNELYPDEWDAWIDNNMPAKQTQIYKAALKYGASYVALENLGQEKPEIKLLSTRDTIAYFYDPVNDIHPTYALSIRSYPLDENNPGRAVYYDNERITHYDFTSEGKFVLRSGEDYPHNLGHCPITRYVCEVDDAGAVRGVIEPAIPAQDRVNQTCFDLLVTQTFSSFKVRWAAGLVGDPVFNEDGTPVRDEEGNQVYKPIQVSQARMLSVDDPTAKFGTLDETPLDGFIQALEASIKQFAVIGQLPPHSLLGNMSNLSAETLVAAMSQTMRFGHVLKTNWAASHQALLHLVALDMGIVTADDDYRAEVRWRDMSDQTLVAVMDGLGKGAQMLAIPPRALWDRVPGVTDGELAEWDRLKEEQKTEELIQGGTPGAALNRERRPAAPRTPTPADVFGGANGNSTGG